MADDNYLDFICAATGRSASINDTEFWSCKECGAAVLVRVNQHYLGTSALNLHREWHRSLRGCGPDCEWEGAGIVHRPMCVKWEATSERFCVCSHPESVHRSGGVCRPFATQECNCPLFRAVPTDTESATTGNGPA